MRSRSLYVALTLAVALGACSRPVPLGPGDTTGTGTDTCTGTTTGTGSGSTELAEAVGKTFQAVCKVRAPVEFVALGKLPNDGKVIEDIRKVV